MSFKEEQLKLLHLILFTTDKSKPAAIDNISENKADNWLFALSIMMCWSVQIAAKPLNTFGDSRHFGLNIYNKLTDYMQ